MLVLPTLFLKMDLGVPTVVQWIKNPIAAAQVATEAQVQPDTVGFSSFLAALSACRISWVGD